MTKKPGFFSKFFGSGGKPGLPSTSDPAKKTETKAPAPPETEPEDPKWSLNKGTESESKSGKGSLLQANEEKLPESPADFLDQGMRVIVPVDIQAYVVEKSPIIDESEPLDMSELLKSGATSVKEAKPSKFGKNNPEPNWLEPGTVGHSLPRGIHLHWAMPDALMRGEEIDPVVLDPKIGDMQVFPNLPDRWLVIRQWPDQSSPTDNSLDSSSHLGWNSKAWVINANDKTTTELSQWNSPGCQESVMTVIDSDGDPNTEESLTWTAVYQESRGRFTFHDKPGTGIHGPLNYMVAGWYSTASQDPIYCHNGLSRGAWKDRLEELGWSVIEQEILDRIDELNTQSGGTGGGYMVMEMANDFDLEFDTDVVKVHPDAQPIGPHWPKQTLFCGHMVGVQWGNGGGEYAAEELETTDIDVAIGRTQSESVASLISSRRGGVLAAKKVLEEALTALGLGVLDLMDEPDGDMVLDHAVHRQSFMPKADPVPIDGNKIVPSGYRVNGPDQSGNTLVIDTGTDVLSPGQSFTIYGVTGIFSITAIDVSVADGSNVTQFTFSPLGGGPLAAHYNPQDDAEIFIVEDVEFAGPNFYEPKELNLVISNSRRSTRYGEDGIYDEEGLLLCRVSLGKSPLDTHPFSWGGVYSIQDIPNHASIPNEIHWLHRTCFFFGLAQFCQSSTYAEILKDYADGFVFDDFTQFSNIAMDDEAYTEPYIDPCAIYLRSPLAINTWTQAWVPVFLDYTIELHPLTQSDWTLGDIDFNLDVANVQDALSTTPDEFVGRSFLFGKSGALIANQIDSLIQNVDILNVNVINATDTQYLVETKNRMKAVDILSATIGDDDLQLTNIDPSLLDSAILDVVKLSIVDIFGQVMTLQKGTASPLDPFVALSLETEDDGRYALLRPRFSQFARLNLTMLDVQDDETRANPALTPMVGFLLPDHLEWALEVFDSQGCALGQLRVAERDWILEGYQTGRVVWDPCPGAEVELGAAPDTGNEHLDTMLQEIIRISLDDEIRVQEKERTGDPLTSEEEGILSALMRGIDTSLHAVDPRGKTAQDFPMLFAGRPIALVRAELKLEMEDDSQFTEDELKETFEVK
jgi:hypothetical protein